MLQNNETHYRMNYKLILTILLICSLKITFGQVLKIERTDLAHYFKSDLNVLYFSDGAPMHQSLFFFPTSSIQFDTNEIGTKFLNLKNLNDRSVLRIQVDSDNGYVDIIGLDKLKEDTITLSNLYVIQNQLYQGSLYSVSYHKFPEKRNSSDQKSNDILRETNREAITNDTNKVYSFTLNDSVISAHLKTVRNTIHTSTTYGKSHLWWYRLRHSILGREPKRYTDFKGHYYTIQDIWVGVVNLQ